jgi:hypothetical protein
VFEDWQVTAVVRAPGWGPDDLPDLDEAFQLTGTRDDEQGVVTYVWTVQAMNLGGATQKALWTVRQAVNTAEPREGRVMAPPVRTVPRVIDLRVRAFADGFSGVRLAGTKEASEILGVTPPRVAELVRTRPDFPAPASVLASGPVWEAHTLRRYAATRRRSGGRPRKST